LQRLTQKAEGILRERFTSLMGMMFRPAVLQESLERLAANKAPGVDGTRKVVANCQWSHGETAGKAAERTCGNVAD